MPESTSPAVRNREERLPDAPRRALPSGFEAEAVAHLPLLRKASVGLAGQRSDAEDLVQDAYLRALRASHSFKPGTNLRAWLMTILRNVARNRSRDRRRAQNHVQETGDNSDAVEQAVAGGASPEQALLSRSVAPQLQAALESLPKALRDAVWLRDVEELTYAEIARQLRIPLGTVMSRISRGRRLLHDRLVAAGAGPVRSPRSDS